MNKYEFNYDYLRAVAPAISKKENRYNLEGVYIHDDEKGRHYVATNGHILLHILDSNISGEKLPDKGLIIKSKFKDFKNNNFILNFATQIDNQTIVFGSGENSEIASIIDADYPDYWRVIPENLKSIKTYRLLNSRFLKIAENFMHGLSNTLTTEEDNGCSPVVWKKDNMTVVLMPMRD